MFVLIQRYRPGDCWTTYSLRNSSPCNVCTLTTLHRRNKMQLCFFSVVIYHVLIVTASMEFPFIGLRFDTFVIAVLYAIHDDVIKWKHFPRYWPFVRGIYRSSVNSPHKGQWRGASMFSLICAWINAWVKIARLVILDAIALIMTSS